MGFQSGTMRALVLIAGLTATVGCTQMDRFHGFIPPEDELATLQVGTTTKDDVITLLGRPMADRGLKNNTIYYASSQFRRFGPLAPQEVAREVLAIDFDASDRLRNISRYTLEDGRVVVLDRRVTEDGIVDVTFLGQILGSLGRFDAGTFLDR